MTPDGYRPLEGRLRGPLYSVRLYVGENHLLKSTVAGVHENYKRYAWEDIQAFSLRATGWGGLLNVLCVLLLFCIAMAWISWSPGWHATLFGFLPFIGVLLGILLYNVGRGPTCEVRIRTAVSDDWLGSLHRVKLARRELEKLKAIVLAKQAAALEGVSEPAIAAPAMLPGPEPKPWDGGAWHLAGFATLVAGLAMNILYLTVPWMKKPIESVGIAVSLAGLAVCIGMILVQSRRATSPGLRTFGWLNLWYNVVSILLLGAVVIITMVREIQKAATKAGEAAAPDIEAFVRPATAAEAILILLLLAYGGYALLRHRALAPPPSSSGA